MVCSQAVANGIYSKQINWWKLILLSDDHDTNEELYIRLLCGDLAATPKAYKFHRNKFCSGEIRKRVIACFTNAL